MWSIKWDSEINVNDGIKFVIINSQQIRKEDDYDRLKYNLLA